MVTIERLTVETAHVALANLVQLLRDAVDSGASIGFLPPLDGDTARSYWIEMIAALAGNTRVLLAARESGQIVGTIQLALATQQNARSADGTLHTTVFCYRMLEGQPASGAEPCLA